MKLDLLCRMELRYTGDFHLARPYGNDAASDGASAKEW